MKIELTPAQAEAQQSFRAFVDAEIMPHADEYDREERTPPEVIRRLAELGYLGATISEQYSGRGMDMVTFGLLCEELGRGSISLLSLLTVHGMVTQALTKWGSPAQREHWLPKLATGEVIGALGLTEPNIGSDAKSIESSAVLTGDSYLLNGRKKWISFGQVADLFLIIAQCEGKPSAFLVERKDPGFSSKPISGMLGFRSAMLAELHLDDCRIPSENLVARVGFGFSHVIGSALDYGRYCVGCGCVGLGQACLEASVSYVNKRKQFGSYLREHQLIQQMIANMITSIKAARLLNYSAGYLKDTGDPDTIMETSIAKYFASQMVNRVAQDAVQIHGAAGCSSEYPVQRYLRDAKIMEIIEGSTQIQQIIISTYGCMKLARKKRTKT
ncbi:MAG: acyl-CoA dehydrogenase family protein [Proteobacteria bacterium]|nr:acyl-CoA dehydrogenase family protein [Pseudomonadota bacterium]MBU1714994.1 acyl-CoA dehydrogenase family protein [Pseudomonadota bacterium]